MKNSRILAAVARTVLTLAVLATFVTLLTPDLQGQEVAVVVNPANPITDISIRDLGRLYMGESTKFPGGGKVVTYEEASVREAFYKSALDMSVGDVQRHWIQATFSGDGAVAPEELSGAGSVLSTVAGSTDAIAVVLASAVDGSVKVVTVDGAGPGDAGYKIR